MSFLEQPSRLILVSNRLPYSIEKNEAGIQLVPSVGGLASGLLPLRKMMNSLWIGWSGLSSTGKKGIDQKILREKFSEEKCLPIEITGEDFRGYYRDFSNGVIWPVFHFLPAKLPIHIRGWEAYKKVNQIFADAVVAEYREGDLIWVHDYHLMLCSAMIREKLPHAPIGYFLHIPFPSTEVFRVIPHRDELLEGLLGADVIGFHTSLYSINFQGSALRTLGLEYSGDSFEWQGRKVSSIHHPLGVDFDFFDVAGRTQGIDPSIVALRTRHPNLKVFLSVDRADYTKGIPNRLYAVQRLFETHPELIGKVMLVQIAVPTRSDVPAYDATMRQIYEIVGSINGKFGRPGYQPIHIVNKSYGLEALASLYLSVDAMLVTPLRDGMNLVAKEFCASRTDEDGILILSEFAGAAAEMTESVLVNPFDVDDMANAMFLATQMNASERSERMKSLRWRLQRWSNYAWGSSFLNDVMERRGQNEEVRGSKPISAKDLISLIEPAPKKLRVILDYDGTLSPIVKIPSLAAPNEELLRVLHEISLLELVEVIIVTGRSRWDMDRWLGNINITIFAEHGSWFKENNHWKTEIPNDQREHLETIKRIIERFTIETPGSSYEQKDFSLVWHYRNVDADLARRKVGDLRYELSEAIKPSSLQIFGGKSIVEVRHALARKNNAIRQILKKSSDDASYVVIGDDVTDEDMFRELGDRGVSVSVGNASIGAQYVISSVSEVVKFLNLLVVDRKE